MVGRYGRPAKEDEAIPAGLSTFHPTLSTAAFLVSQSGQQQAAGEVAIATSCRFRPVNSAARQLRSSPARLDEGACSPNVARACAMLGPTCRATHEPLSSGLQAVRARRPRRRNGQSTTADPRIIADVGHEELSRPSEKLKSGIIIGSPGSNIHAAPHQNKPLSNSSCREL